MIQNDFVGIEKIFFIVYLKIYLSDKKGDR